MGRDYAVVIALKNGRSVVKTPLLSPDCPKDCHDVFDSCKRLEAGDDWEFGFDEEFSKELMLATRSEMAAWTLEYAPDDVGRN